MLRLRAVLAIDSEGEVMALEGGISVLCCIGSHEFMCENEMSYPKLTLSLTSHAALVSAYPHHHHHRLHPTSLYLEAISTFRCRSKVSRFISMTLSVCYMATVDMQSSDVSPSMA